MLRGGDGANGGNDFSARYRSMFKLNEAMKSIKEGYERRIAADPSFLSKSLLEIVLAASTQYMAEVGRRGKGRILPEIDFVFAGILTAVCGKYYSMWRVARTVDADATVMSGGGTEVGNAGDVKNDDAATKTKNNWRDRIRQRTHSSQPSSTATPHPCFWPAAWHSSCRCHSSSGRGSWRPRLVWSDVVPHLGANDVGVLALLVTTIS